MNSTTDPKAIEPDDALVARADQRLVHAYAQIARADEQLARINERLSKLEHNVAHDPLAGVGHRPALRGSSACYWPRASLPVLSFRSPPMAMRPS
jgi:hypothetical protein